MIEVGDKVKIKWYSKHTFREVEIIDIENNRIKVKGFWIYIPLYWVVAVKNKNSKRYIPIAKENKR